jgi:hypothetical protein
MKIISTLSVIIIFVVGCNSAGNETKVLNSRIDSLEKKLANTYKPGLGEFMSAIQVHHAKLWFAGLNENWELADFEVHEIAENLEAIKEYQTERPEVRSLSILEPAIDSVKAAIEKKKLPDFKSSYILLTNSCNECHKAVNYSFNEVKVPDAPPFSNQVFKQKNK